MNIAIIQSRYNSSRLPGKAMMKIQDKTTLEHVIDRVSAAINIDDIWIATGEAAANNPIRELCNKKNIKCFSGDNDNVLKRFCDLLLTTPCKISDNIVRITADCPLIDPKIIDKMLNQIGSAEYIGNQNNMIDGFDVEIIKAKNLFDAWIDYEFDEHVTLKWKEGNKDKLTYYWYDKKDRSKIHLSLDTEKDYKSIGKIFDSLYPKNPLFQYKNVLSYLESANV